MSIDGPETDGNPIEPNINSRNKDPVVEIFQRGSKNANEQNVVGKTETGEASNLKEIEKSLDEIKSRILESVTPEGLIPEIGERGSDEGFNSEMLGYGLRIAVETGDRDLFDRLKKGADQMKMDNGLYRARLDREKKPDLAQGSTWADANQDIALALIEAGEVWSNDELLNEGIDVARAFLRAQVAGSGEWLVPLQNTVEEDESVAGKRLRRVNPSMYNFKLYEKMLELDQDNTVSWAKLKESGIDLIGKCLDTYKLPPNTFNLIDGDLVTNEQLVQGVKSGDLADTIPEELSERIISAPEDSESAKSIWGFDSMRVPFRLNDSESEEAKSLASKIRDRLDELGGVRTKYFALDGEQHSDGMSAAVVESPLVVSTAKKMGSKEAAIKILEDRTTDTDNNVLYWQMWRGLGLIQLEDAEV